MVMPRKKFDEMSGMLDRLTPMVIDNLNDDIGFLAAVCVTTGDEAFEIVTSALQMHARAAGLRSTTAGAAEIAMNERIVRALTEVRGEFRDTILKQDVEQ